MEQNIVANKPLQEAMMDYYNWANANIFGKVRKVLDVFEYSIGWTGLAASFHAESDALKNVSTSDLSLALAMTNSTTNMLLNYNLLKAGAFEMLSCFKEWKLGAMTAAANNTVDNVTSGTVVGQTIALTGLTNTVYYVIYIPTSRACKVELFNAALDASGGSIINNTTIGTTGGLPAGFTGIMFLPSAATATFKLSAALGVGLTNGAANTQLKLYPVTAWSAHECKIWSSSNEV